MYVPNGTLFEAAAFIEGFYSGMAAHNMSKGAQAEVAKWSNFCQWANEKMNGEKMGGWYDLFYSLRQTYPNDSEAFAHLAKLCLEYHQESRV